MVHRSRLRALLAAFFVLGGAACGIFDGNSFTILGTVEFADFEGGCWIIHGRHNTYYTPINLPGELREQGLAVRAIVRSRGDVLGFCSAGEFVEILTIERQQGVRAWPSTPLGAGGRP